MFITSHLYWVLLSDVPTEAPTAVTTLPFLDPPIFLSANRTDRGIFLQWLLPEAPSSPLTGFVLQSRRDQGQWVVLNSDISANQSELLVQGLFRVPISSFFIFYLKDLSVWPLDFLHLQPGCMSIHQLFGRWVYVKPMSSFTIDIVELSVGILLCLLSLHQDSSYDLRLMSCSNKALSEPSESVNVSTLGK